MAFKRCKHMSSINEGNGLLYITSSTLDEAGSNAAFITTCVYIRAQCVIQFKKVDC